MEQNEKFTQKVACNLKSSKILLNEVAHKMSAFPDQQYQYESNVQFHSDLGSETVDFLFLREDMNFLEIYK